MVKQVLEALQHPVFHVIAVARSLRMACLQAKCLQPVAPVRLIWGLLRTWITQCTTRLQQFAHLFATQTGVTVIDDENIRNTGEELLQEIRELGRASGRERVCQSV